MLVFHDYFEFLRGRLALARGGECTPCAAARCSSIGLRVVCAQGRASVMEEELFACPYSVSASQLLAKLL
jgi:hypothetical protein